MSTINERLKETRKALGLTTTKLAEIISYSHSTISLIENARHPYDNPEKIADSYIRLFVFAFNVNENWLRTGAGNMFNASPRGLPGEAIAAQLLELVDKVPPEELRRIVKEFVGRLVDSALISTEELKDIIDQEQENTPPAGQ